MGKTSTTRKALDHGENKMKEIKMQSYEEEFKLPHTDHKYSQDPILWDVDSAVAEDSIFYPYMNCLCCFTWSKPDNRLMRRKGEQADFIV